MSDDPHKDLDLDKLHFVRLWYSPEINCIEDFIEAAHKNDHIKFKRKGDGSGSDEDKAAVNGDATKLRQCIARYVFGTGERDNKDSTEGFHFGEPFVRWEARDAKGVNFRWHVRALPKRNRKVTVTPTKKANRAAFHKLFGKDQTVYWGD